MSALFIFHAYPLRPSTMHSRLCKYWVAMAGLTWKRLLWGIGVPGLLLLLASGTPFSVFAQFATSDRVSQPEFWPTQTRYPRSLYAGPQACASCHRTIFDEALQTSMAHTAMPVSESNILRFHPDLTFAQEPNHYEIRTVAGKSVYTVSNGTGSKSAVLTWAFGTDRVAQSWLFKKSDGQFYEVRVTYFRTLKDLNFTPGRAVMAPQDVDEAMDRQVGTAEVYTCFGCHTTASGIGSSFDDSKLIPGVSCEACHGPGQAHIDKMQEMSAFASVRTPVENTENAIFNPKKLTPEESVDFCGACHGSYWDVSLSGITGVDKARFQPYRLEQSKCWNKNDARLTCTACHDPHQQVDTRTDDYDHVCLSCHLTSSLKGTEASAKTDKSHPGPICPVAKSDCASCHMPEVYVPDMHRSFPDHRIRIARADDPFPD